MVGVCEITGCTYAEIECVLSTAWKIVESDQFVSESSYVDDDGASSTKSGRLLASTHNRSDYADKASSAVPPLPYFIHELLRRSRISFNTVRAALCYVEAVAAELPTLMKEAPPGGNVDISSLRSPLLCPRRTLLASMILASKFLHDRSYSNKAWAKLTGLAAAEVGRCERVLFAQLHFRLWTDKCSESPPVIEGLDMEPVVALDMIYQPQTTPPNMYCAQTTYCRP
ncbi:hypothetical protein AURDEDRAFT_177004 [Auricularia subglabra TFB-10046 SS5]|uniref:Cyclin N-terminal domain-containing protein n=1 Tax=Auricularia subglabra (strain TFB-10046 / SS5) TaxID=717982 RepID=J0WQ02_AURST|nr:hypothetical protein AURDEDRAFT_177004 [Auricularia subglabra TFB-10046 SS5]